MANRDDLVRIPENPVGPGRSGYAPGQLIRRRGRKKRLSDSDLSRLAVRRALQ